MESAAPPPDGVSPAWPIDYETLEPFYEQAERLYHVHGDSAGNVQQILPADASIWWYTRNCGIVILVSVIFGYIALRVFDRAEGNFAEVI